MSTPLFKTYEPSSVEIEALRVWNDEKLFHAEPTDPGNPYSIVIPPPNVTAALHLGHALNNTLQDILTRWHRMLGDNTCWLPGTDHAGIATQTVVEKRVLAEEGKRRTDFKREEFVAKIQAWKDDYEQRITAQLKRMGCSCDWDRQAFTMDEPRAKAVREAFFKLFKDGLIYRGKRLVNWDPATQTALADDEVEMEEVDGHFYYLKYPVVDEQETQRRTDAETRCADDSSSTSSLRLSVSSSLSYITVATTRPETMLGDTAVAINPKDPRAAGLRGKKVRLPIVNRIVPIIEDEYVVLADPNSDDPKARFATGFLKVTPAHDPNDYELGRKHNLPMINVMGPDGSISDQHGWSDVGDAEFVLGLDRYEAREAIVEWFRKNKLLEDVKPYRHTVGHSYRSHVAIEPYLSDQWYLKVTDDRLAGAALRAMAADQKDQRDTGLRPVQSSPADENPSTSEHTSHGPEARVTGKRSHDWESKLRFYPPRYAKTFQTWHENIRDWCISRQLWWGHRIPVWKWSLLFDASEEEARKGMLAEDSAVSPNDPTDPEDWPFTECAMQTFRDPKTRALTYFACPPPGRADIERALEEKQFVQDPDVLDTWFSSGLWPLSTLHWPDESQISDPKSALNTWNPTSVLTTAREIITLWVSRMVMFNLYFLDRLPFYDVFIHAMIQDGEGRKMSKSLGNGVDPLDIIESHGADAMRFTLCHMTTQTQDVRMPVEKVAGTDKNTSPKFDIGRNFCNKIWNAARFAISNLEGQRDRGTKGQSENSGPSVPSSLRPSSNLEGQRDTGTKGQSENSGPSVPSSLHPSSNLEGQRDRGTKGQSENSGPSVPSSLRPSVPSLSLFDRWILSRLSATIDEVNDALKSYRFDAYAKACYDFFWRDLCDWYVEAIKPAMKDPDRAGTTSAVLAAAVDGALRIMHPVLPFITETIFWKLNEARKQRTIVDMIELDPSDRLINAKWPRPVAPMDTIAEQKVTRIQEIITAIRNLRNEHKVEPKRTVNVSINVSVEMAWMIEFEVASVIELLATCKLDDGQSKIPEKAIRLQVGGTEVYVSGLADEAAEQQRIAKRREELTKQQKAMEARLSNESYIAKAPPNLVQQTRDQLAQIKKELESLGG